MEKSMLVRSLLAVGVLSVPLLIWKLKTPDQIEFSSIDLGKHPGELSIRPFDEPFSLPDRGSSLFDKVFSVPDASGVRQYVVPYPFSKIVERLRTVSQVDPKIVFFPMGRSLQRSAAIDGMKEVKNLDPFYRFPRGVLGFDQESKNFNGQLALNLKDRLYIGMNEKAKLLEVISYNDEAGRFEFQVVRDFEAGKKPQVFYANRQLCLSCHQNQTPIFSRAPWDESNANETQQKEMLRVLRKTLGDSNCQTGEEVFCVKNANGQSNYFYQGAPVMVDTSIPYALDQTTKNANYFHAYHKMWQRLCPDLECRKAVLQQVFLYRLTGQKGMLQTEGIRRFNTMISQRWSEQFPKGMKIPEAAIPNRDPLLHHKDRGREESLIDGRQSHVKTGLEQVLANSDVPGEFEPLLPRNPSEVWDGPMNKEGGITRLVWGYSQFFTDSDAREVDQLLIQSQVPSNLIEKLQSNCKIKRGSNPLKRDYSISCVPSGNTGLNFSTYLRIPPGRSDLSGNVSLIRLFPIEKPCDPGVIATPEELISGRACPQVMNAVSRLRDLNETEMILSFELQNGLSVRFLDGRRLGDFTLPILEPGEERALALEIQILRDAGPLVDALNKAAQNGTLLKIIDGPAINRLPLMGMLLDFMGQPRPDAITLTKSMMSLKKESEAPLDEVGELPLKPNERAIALANRNCAVCHFNREDKPTAFLGGPQLNLNFVSKCQLVAACSARMLYRLKMWECPESDFEIKKTPMPPTSRMKAIGVDLEKWKGHDRKQLIASLQSIFPEKELRSYLRGQDLSVADIDRFLNDLKGPSCPQDLSTFFEKLPRCDHSFSPDESKCQ